MPIWDREFEFEIKLAGYLLEVIPGWSVTAAGWPVGEKASGFRLQASGFRKKEPTAAAMQQ
jgi:hypothetical protein